MLPPNAFWVAKSRTAMVVSWMEARDFDCPAGVDFAWKINTGGRAIKIVGGDGRSAAFYMLPKVPVGAWVRGKAGI